MSNPRKFSEKIALHTQKQAEETADFEKIMNEVRNAKPNQIVSIGVSLQFTVYLRHTPKLSLPSVVELTMFFGKLKQFSLLIATFTKHWIFFILENSLWKDLCPHEKFHVSTFV
jgi:hypothetical protein